MSFSVDVAKFAKSTKSDMGEAKQAIVFNVFAGGIKKTPVDSGRAKGSWQISHDTTPNFSPIGNLDKSAKGQVGAAGMAELNKITTDFGLDFLTSNLVYMHLLEFGGYNHATERTTSAGFSSQAPAGMLRVTVSEFSAIAKREGWT